MKVTEQMFQAEFVDRTERAADKALRSLDRLVRECEDAKEQIGKWSRGESALRPEIHHQRVGDAMIDVEAYAQVAGFAAEHRRYRLENPDNRELKVYSPVRHSDSPDDSDNAGVIVGLRDGVADLVAPGPEGIGVELIEGASVGDLVWANAEIKPAVLDKADELIDPDSPDEMLS